MYRALAGETATDASLCATGKPAQVTPSGAPARSRQQQAFGSSSGVLPSLRRPVATASGCTHLNARQLSAHEHSSPTVPLHRADAVSCRGGGSKRRLREVDFVRRQEGVEGVVERLEYDPNRTGYIALVKYPPGEDGDRFCCDCCFEGGDIVSCAVLCCAVLCHAACVECCL